MGYKIAEEALKRKHKVILISGPTDLVPPKADKIIFIKTADDLLTQLRKHMPRADCLVMCAAVGDFRVRRISDRKIKRNRPLDIKLVPNKDILKELNRFHERKLFIGFSLETEGLARNSYRKLKNKNLDLIAANRLTKYHNPFGNNKLDVDLIDKNGNVTKIRKKGKVFISHVLLDKIDEMWYELNNRGSGIGGAA